MSFSKEVKEELSKINNLVKKEELKCEFLGYLASDNITEGKKTIKYCTENDYNIDRFAKIIRNIGIEKFDININGKVFYIEINKKYIDYSEIDYNTKSIEDIKCFIRGVFMGAGSINNPESSYHLECRLKSKEVAIKITYMLKNIGINMKQKDNIMYIKEGEEISKFLAFIGANKSILKFEEIRVQRHMNNKVNRLVNCESANLNKVLNASIEQVDAIRKLKENGKFEVLDESLKKIAELRLEFPDMPLIELGQKLSPPLGKSGVNYRLKKIMKLAEEV